jgi:hypothetical protein
MLSKAPALRPRLPDGGWQMAYTERQIELIRARLKTYYGDGHPGPGKITWGGFCDEIFALTQVHVDAEVLRQFVYRTQRRDRPRIPRQEILDAFVLFLTHPDVGMLSPEQLRDAGAP